MLHILLGFTFVFSIDLQAASAAVDVKSSAADAKSQAAAAGTKIACSRSRSYPDLRPGVICPKGELRDIHVQRGVQASWQDLHPYKMAANVVESYICSEVAWKTGHQEFVRNLEGYSSFNKWVARVFLAIPNYADDMKKSIREDSSLSPQQKQKLINIIKASQRLGYDATYLVCSWVEAEHRASAEQCRPEYFPKEMWQIIYGYYSEPWGISVAQIKKCFLSRVVKLSDIVNPPAKVELDLSGCMLSSIEGLDIPNETSQLTLFDNFIEELSLDLPDQVEVVWANNDFLQRLVFHPRPHSRLRLLTLANGLWIGPFPEGIEDAFPLLKELNLGLQPYGQYMLRADAEKYYACQVRLEKRRKQHKQDWYQQRRGDASSACVVS